MENQLRNELMGLSGLDTYRKNYLIEAGAGAGKTYTMVHRIANQLISGMCDPKNMAVITFTNKATEELRARLDTILQEMRDKATDPAEKLRLDELIRSAGRMQVSTIHSFCKTMLESVPFETDLGMKMTYVEDEFAVCEEFFERKYREDPTQFARVEQLGIRCRYLANSFAALCGMGDGAIKYHDECSAEMQARIQLIVQKIDDVRTDLLKKLQACAPAQALADEEIFNLLSMSQTAFSADRENSLQLAALIAFRKHPLKLYESDSFLDSVKRGGSAPKDVADAWKPIRKTWEDAQASLETVVKELVHSRSMPILLKLADEYTLEKRDQHIVSSNDLLTFTRNLLRDRPVARQILHDRYKVLYVDEFQDTDPVQAQVLFYLTTDPKAFNTDWRLCKPVHGSLFLVGDPKQAIYRFRGADIDVYKEVEAIFRSGIGYVKRLAFNFRSAKEICDLTELSFQPDPSAKAPTETEPVSAQLDGGYYQAAYAGMDAQKGSCPLARTIRYEPLKAADLKMSRISVDAVRQEDAKRVAAFISKMVTDGVPVGHDAHPASYGDFLILPHRKSDVDNYAAALTNAGIPVNITGKKIFREIDPIHRLLIHLDSLSAPGNDLALGRVLFFCYDIKLPTIRRFLQQANEYSLSAVMTQSKLEQLGTAFSNATPKDEEILALCAVLKELEQLHTRKKTAPPFSMIEILLDGGYGIWQSNPLITERRREYAYVQQFLQLLRRCPERGFSALAAYAAECSEHQVEHELTLQHDPNAVRVMNIHKSKGLEGEIVILPFGTLHTTNPLYHTKRSASGTEHYNCLYITHGLNSSVRGVPLAWNYGSAGTPAHSIRESNYLEAERVRLLYVAATRAKSMLLVCDNSEKNDGYWKTIAQNCAPLNVSDPNFGDQLACLTTSPIAVAASAAAPLPTPTDTAAVEQALEVTAQSHLSRAQYPIVPSKLDHLSRTAAKRKDREDDLPDPNSDDSATTPESTPIADKEFSPHGPDWGTIVHRIMELAVRENAFDENALLRFARQAVSETLPTDFLTASQRKILLRDPDEPDSAKQREEISSSAAAASAFLTDPTSPLRGLLTGGKCYPELPFILRETDRNSALYRHLSDHISDPDAEDKELDVQGIIDLAIWKDGAWIIVDYKTDRVKSGESKEQFVQRLRDEYTPQIASYAQVLERLGQGSVVRCCLCSIPLKGELIELTLN